ncbi:MAG: RagB/SusD family nutrient uptake outer membrane protein [Rikenellaceae bacterium]|nr:RagB/SusD family nutrient uptake outer membrane protein [Rikenellaceae bacterium]
MMKKLSLIIIALLLAGNFTSCNMDEYPADGIAQNITSIEDAKNLRIGLYSKLKHRTLGTYYNLPDYQSDLFHASATWGNYYGDWYSWNIQNTNLTLERLFYGWYGTIANCNFLIEGIENLLAAHENSYTDDQKEELRLYYGEAHWIRAYCYYNLAIDWCEAYNSSTADQTLGIMLQTVYAPSSVVSTYPARSSLAETFQLIVDDLQVAEDNIKVDGVSGSYYITKDVVSAMQARVALYMGEWATAITKANSVITPGRYPLIDNQTDFDDLWVYDYGIENIFVTEVQAYNDFEAAAAEPLDYDTGFYFLFNHYYQYQTYNPQFIPEQWVINLYAGDDIRLGSYYEYTTIYWPQLNDYDLWVITKFPGNPNLNVGGSPGTWYYVNKGKVFRSAEMYLIAAEAYYNNNNESGANQMLNELRAARIPSWTTTPYTGTTLRDEIRNERVRELYAEGNRLADLKRWGLPMTRTTPQNAGAVFSLYTNLSVSAGDYRFLWPIPQREVDNNPQVEQNPQY